MAAGAVLEQHKENIQARPEGRAGAPLSAQLAQFNAASAPAQRADLDALHAEFVARVARPAGDTDPLQAAVEHLRELRAQIPSGDSRAIRETLNLCVNKFSTDRRYTNDRRFLRIWLDFVKLARDPIEAFKYMAQTGVGAQRAVFYEEYAAALEARGWLRHARDVYLFGLLERAEPRADLKRAYAGFKARHPNPQGADEPEDAALPRRAGAARGAATGATGSGPTGRPDRVLATRAAPGPASASSAQSALAPASAPAPSTQSALNDANGLKKITIFQDTDTEPVAGPVPDFSDKENSQSGQPWAGQRLPQAGQEPPKKLLKVFRDSASSASADSAGTAVCPPSRNERHAVDLALLADEHRTPAEIMLVQRGLQMVAGHPTRQEVERARQPQPSAQFAADTPSGKQTSYNIVNGVMRDEDTWTRGLDGPTRGFEPTAFLDVPLGSATSNGTHTDLRLDQLRAQHQSGSLGHLGQFGQPGHPQSGQSGHSQSGHPGPGQFPQPFPGGQFPQQPGLGAPGGPGGPRQGGPGHGHMPVQGQPGHMPVHQGQPSQTGPAPGPQPRYGRTVEPQRPQMRAAVPPRSLKAVPPTPIALAPLTAPMEPVVDAATNEVRRRVYPRFRDALSALPIVRFDNVAKGAFQSYKTPPVAGRAVSLPGFSFVLSKTLGEGGFGIVLRTKVIDGVSYAVKVEKSPIPWELYTVLQLRARIDDDRARRSIVEFRLYQGFTDEQYTVMPVYNKGTLLKLTNAVYNSPSSNPRDIETVAVYFAVELLRTMAAVHRAGVIHGDLKPENVMLRVMTGGAYKWPSSHFQRADPAWAKVGIVLLDFGRSIDTHLFPPGQKFRTGWQIDREQDCYEACEGLPWTYEIDYHGIANIIFHMLQGQAMKVVRQSGSGLKVPSTPLGPRASLPFWHKFFRTLLNPPQVPLADVAALQSELETWLEKRSEPALNTLLSRYT